MENNERLRKLKQKYKWLTNPLIAAALQVSVSRVNSWTRYQGPAMDWAFLELLEQMIKGGYLSRVSTVHNLNRKQTIRYYRK